LYKLFTKYETKFGAARSQKVPHPSAHSSKKKQAWAKIFGEQAGSGVVGPPLPLPPHLVVLLVSSKLTETVIVSLLMMMILT